MWDLQTVNNRNRRIAEAYYAATPPRQRLADRLIAVSTTSAEQNALILAAFDAAPAEVRARLLEMDVANLLAAGRQVH